MSPGGIAVGSAVAGLTGRRNQSEPATTEPIGERKLLAVLAIRINADFASILCAKEMHRIGDHHCPFVEMVLQIAIGLAPPVWGRRQRANEVVEIHECAKTVVRGGS